MPTLLIWNGHRFFFYSADRDEPPHVHVMKAGCEAKIWLLDLAVAANFGYARHDLAEVVERTRRDRDAFLKAWHEHFDD